METSGIVRIILGYDLRDARQVIQSQTVLPATKSSKRLWRRNSSQDMHNSNSISKGRSRYRVTALQDGTGRCQRKLVADPIRPFPSWRTCAGDQGQLPTEGKAGSTSAAFS